jgi:hypothetical protein
MKNITKGFLISRGSDFYFNEKSISKKMAEYCIEDGDKVHMWMTAEGDVYGGVKSGRDTLVAKLPASAWDAVKGDDGVRPTMPDTYTRFGAAM